MYIATCVTEELTTYITTGMYSSTGMLLLLVSYRASNIIKSINMVIYTN